MSHNTEKDLTHGEEEELTNEKLKEKEIWDCYNGLLLSADISRLRKIAVRHYLFMLSLETPGDIVELGVFKGTGLLTFLKYLMMHMPGSTKKVVGFDIFEDVHLLGLKGDDKTHMDALYKEADFKGVRMEKIQSKAEAVAPGRTTLVKGNICQTVQSYVDKNPGARFSFVYFDLDVAAPTKSALEALWDRIPRGGVLVFDEYGIDRWSESEAVDTFFKDKNQKMLTLPWANSPTAYMIKQ